MQDRTISLCNTKKIIFEFSDQNSNLFQHQQINKYSKGSKNVTRLFKKYFDVGYFMTFRSRSGGDVSDFRNFLYDLSKNKPNFFRFFFLLFVFI